MIIAVNKKSCGVSSEVASPVGAHNVPVVVRTNRKDKVMDIAKYMQMSIDVMRSSVQEHRDDSKPSPFVGR